MFRGTARPLTRTTDARDRVLAMACSADRSCRLGEGEGRGVELGVELACLLLAECAERRSNVEPTGVAAMAGEHPFERRDRGIAFEDRADRREAFLYRIRLRPVPVGIDLGGQRRGHVGRGADAADPARPERREEIALRPGEYLESGEAPAHRLHVRPVARAVLYPDDGRGEGPDKALDEVE